MSKTVSSKEINYLELNDELVAKYMHHVKKLSYKSIASALKLSNTKSSVQNLLKK